MELISVRTRNMTEKRGFDILSKASLVEQTADVDECADAEKICI